MTRATCLIAFAISALFLPFSSQAYVGPSFGLGVIGTVLAVIAVALLSLMAFVVLPIRRFLKKRRLDSDAGQTDSTDE